MGAMAGTVDLDLPEIVASAAAGDEVAFGRLVAAYDDEMYRVSVAVCRDQSVAADAVQAAWAIAWRKLRSVRDPNVVVDPQRKRECPRCEDVKLKRRFFSRHHKIEVDECPGCGGIWLDPGELEKIREELAASKVHQQVRETRAASNRDLIRYLYELRRSE